MNHHQQLPSCHWFYPSFTQFFQGNSPPSAGSTAPPLPRLAASSSCCGRSTTEWFRRSRWALRALLGWSLKPGQATTGTPKWRLSMKEFWPPLGEKHGAEEKGVGGLKICKF